MRKYIFLFFSALTLLWSCGDDKPDNVLDKEHMVNLLVDMHITDGELLSQTGKPDSLYKYGTDKYQRVFRVHHTDSATFNRSFKYYSLNAAEMVDIYNEALNKLTTKMDSLNKALQKSNSSMPVAQ